MSATITKVEQHRRQWFSPVIGFMVERFVFSALSVFIVYAAYRMFLL